MNPHVVLNPSILTGGILFEIPRNGIYLQFEGFEVSREGVHEVYFPNGGHAE